MDETQDVQRALSDIALIRGILDRTRTGTTPHGVTLKANLLIQALIFAIALAVLLVEFFYGTATSVLAASRLSSELQLFGVGFMAMVLVGLLVPLYFVLWRAARHSSEPLGMYIDRNFAYIRNLSLISDLLIKFFTVALVLLAGKPEWIASVLLVFTGDYLLQGRLFTLPTKVAAALGVVCVVGGVAQFLSGLSSLCYPLAAFCLVLAISTGRLVLLGKTSIDQSA